MTRATKNRFPADWDEDRVRDVLEHYETQTEEEAMAEDEAAYANSTMMAVPSSVVPDVRRLIARYEKKQKAS